MALRAGSVGLGCEAGLGSSRGWGSSCPVALLSPPLEARCAARLAGLSSAALVSSCGGFRGAVSDAVWKAGRWRGSGTAVVAATLDARRALLADLPSYGARWAPFARGPGGSPRLAPSS